MADVTTETVPAGKGARTRQALLDAAVAHFATLGRRGASVPAVARTVGITSSAVYAHFPTKQALFEAAVDADISGLLLDALPDVMDGTFEGDFASVFRQLLGALPAHPLARRILAGEEDCGGAERLATLPSEVRLQSGIARAIRRGQEAGRVRADVDPEEMAVGLEAIVMALVLTILQAGGATDRATAQGVLAVLDASLRPPAQSA